VFEDERAIRALGNVYSALADLEDETGGHSEAVRFEELALRFSYQAGEPVGCAISHHNLSNYLKQQGAEPELILAHRLADATICLQTRSGGMATTVRNMAKTDLPAMPPPFTTVADHVEAVEGVRFRALFERLPRTVPDGDAAIAAVWQMVAEERAKHARMRSALEGLPPELRAALEAGDAGRLAAALGALPSEVRDAFLKSAGREEPALAASEIDELLRRFEPLLQAIAAVARGEAGPREEIETALADLEQKGWLLRRPVQRIWAGERTAESLIQGLDEQDRALVARILDLLEERSE
jgi:hypothetical protein